MTPIDLALREEAERLATRLSREAAAQEPEMIAIRLANYRPRVGLDYHCPSCWMRKEKRVRLDPIPTGTRDDAFECEACGADYLIPR